MERSELSIEQEYALQLVESGQNVFITGPGGTGKSCLIRQIVKSAEKRNSKTQVCAMTGCAAILLGCMASTLHSWSGIKMGKGLACEIITNIRNNKKACSRWRSLKTLILDEVSMLSKRLFEILNEIGKEIRMDPRPFGGLQLVFTGDFYQLPPINGPEEGSGQFCFESDLWYKVFPIDNNIQLSVLFRQNDPVYKSILNNIREGLLDKNQLDILKTRLHISYNKDEHNGVVPTKLFATKYKVDMINNEEFNKLDTECYEFSYIEKTNCTTFIDSGKPLTTQTLLRCKKEITKNKQEMEVRYILENSPMEKELHLKEGANVMCTVNYDMESGICNGSIGIITGFTTGIGIPIPIVTFSNGVVKQMSVKYWQSEEYPTIAVGQIPLKLAWAMTIHKSQGATLTMAEVDIGNTVFECGQSYVALSRIKSLDGLYLCGLNPKKIKVNAKVNDFYKKIPKIEYEEEDEEEEKNENIDFEQYRYVSIN